MKHIRAHLTGSLQGSISAYRKNAGTWKSTTRKAGNRSQHIIIGGNNMTIDEAIAKYKEITNIDANCPAHCNISCDKCVQESEQLAEWLEELKELRNITASHLYAVAFNRGYLKAEKEERNMAIDDFVKEICKMIVQSENNGNYRFYAVEIKQAIADLAEQLKAGVRNGTNSQ